MTASSAVGSQPEFLPLDGLSIRYATSRRPDVPTLLMLSPWPESIFAYRPTWEALAPLLAPLLASLTTPVQTIVGRDDLYALDEDAEILPGQLAHSQLDLLETGHCAWEEAPEQYAAVTSQWLNGAFRKA
jgi:pimeloyl-ACP methyl ester carboxylesterase